MVTFNISADPGTDIWRKPPSTDIFKAPSRPVPQKPLTAFKSALVTFTAPWQHEYDQGGILFQFEDKNPGPQAAKPRWIKTGLEIFTGLPHLSTVACDRYADWSVTPMPEPLGPDSTVSILVSKEVNEHGTSLWFYYLPSGDAEKKVPLREVCWVFGDNDVGRDTLVIVSAFAARPEAKEASQPLEVSFQAFDVEWESE